MSKDELAEYLAFALEMRRRVKEQLKRINPTEFANTDLTYIDKATGAEQFARRPEYRTLVAKAANDPPTASQSNAIPADEPIGTFGGYDLLRSFDTGGMAEAYMARNRSTGQLVFLKRVRRNSTEKDALEREIGIYERLMRMDLRHVLRVLDFVRDEDHVALVTEFADGGDLHSFVAACGGGNGLPVDQVRSIAP